MRQLKAKFTQKNGLDQKVKKTQSQPRQSNSSR